MSNLKKSGNDGWLIKSEAIKVFPCAYRAPGINPEARLNTEYNYTHLPHLADKKSYIISNKAPDDKENGLLCCIVGGYYFEITYAGDDNDILGPGSGYCSKDSEKAKSGYYLNIRVASPEENNKAVEGAIDEAHLISYTYTAGDKTTTENNLDSQVQGEPYYFYGLLITKDAKYNNATDSLKLDDSAYLPIKSDKIEDKITKKPISNTFNTDTLAANSITASTITVGQTNLKIDSSNETVVSLASSGTNKIELKKLATASADNTAIAGQYGTVTNDIIEIDTGRIEIPDACIRLHGAPNSTGLAVAGEVKIASNLTITGGSSINAPAYGNLNINTGNITVDKGSISAAKGFSTVGNDTVDDKGSIISTIISATNGTISGKNLSASEKISGKTGNITNTLTVGNNIEIKDIKNISTALPASAGCLNITAPVEIKETDKYAKISKGGTIFSVNLKDGIVTAPRMDATIKGTIDEAKKVTDQIGDTQIKNIFESNGLVARKASSITATSTTSNAGSTIVTGTAASKVLSLLPGAASKATDCIYNIGSTNRTFDNVYAANFKDGLADNANKISARLSDNTTQIITILTGSVEKNSSNSNKYDLLLTPNTDTTIASINLGTSTNKFDNVYATTFQGDLKGNADTATNAGTAATVSTKIKNVDITAIFVPDSKNTDNITSEVKAANYATRANTITSSSNNGTNIVYGAYANNIAALLPSNNNITINIGSPDKKFSAVYANTFNGNATSATSASTATTADNVDANSIENIKVNNNSLKTSSLISIDSSNNIQVGTNSSTACTAKIGNSSHFICVNATTPTKDNPSIFIQTTRNSTGNCLELKNYNNTSTVNAFTIDYAGNVTATTYNATSDRRLKENIADYKPKKSILDLQVKKFDFINGSKNQIGCIAQDLQEICPEIVSEDKDGMLSIKESKIVYLLLDEVKKLKAEVDELKNK